MLYEGINNRKELLPFAIDIFEKINPDISFYSYSSEFFCKYLKDVKIESIVYKYNDEFTKYNNDIENYKLEYKKYSEALNSYNENIEKIKELHIDPDLVDIEKPAEPKPPKVPIKPQVYALTTTYKGKLLYDFISKQEEINNKNYSKDVRKELIPYLGKDVVVYGNCLEKEGNNYLFKDIVFKDFTIDHMWFYDVNATIEIPGIYEIEGKVVKYNKSGDKGVNFAIKAKCFNKIF